jgi:ubiquinone biosynthesis protein
VARTLDPKLDMWTTSEPVVRDWITRNLGPVGRIEDAAGGAMEIGRFMGQVPGMLNRAARLADQLDAATRDGILLAPETVAAIGKAEARRNRGSTVALWVIAALLAIVTWLLLKY